MKKIIFICSIICMVILLTSCSSAFEKKPEVNIENVCWEVKMGINYLDDRALMVEYTNNSNYVIKELALDFKLKDNIKEEELNNFYLYLRDEYKLSDEMLGQLKEKGISMNSHTYIFEEKEYIKQGEKKEDNLLYGLKFIRNMDYYELFEPELYKIVYINELGEEHTTYYDYLNKTYTER